jgi:adenylate cyclase
VEKGQAEQLVDLAAEVLLQGERRYTTLDVCELVGVDRTTADTLWRAMGFPDVPDGEVAFSDRDVEALRAAIALEEIGVVDEVAVRRQTRVMSQALATIAAAQLEITEDTERHPERFQAFGIQVLTALDDLLVYLYHRHLLAAVEQAVMLQRDEADHPMPALGVGFADLVDFTRTANQIEEEALSALIEDFAEAAADVVAQEAGRVVKMLGDEVMFTASDPLAAATPALRLVAEVGEHEGRPALRAGVAWGSVILRHGDVFGAPVNLAHRLVDLARPGTVLVDEGIHDAIEGADGLDVQRVHSIRRVRGFDRAARVWALRRAG